MAISPPLLAKSKIDSFLCGIVFHKVVKENKALVRDDQKENILPNMDSASLKLHTSSFGVEQYLAVEIYFALIYLHSNKPSIIHENWKPTKVSFGGNYVCKLHYYKNTI